MCSQDMWCARWLVADAEDYGIDARELATRIEEGCVEDGEARRAHTPVERRRIREAIPGWA